MDEKVTGLIEPIIAQLDQVNSKRFFGFLGTEGVGIWLLWSGMIAGPAILPAYGIMTGLALAYIGFETFWPSKKTRTRKKKVAAE